MQTLNFHFLSISKKLNKHDLCLFDGQDYALINIKMFPYTIVNERSKKRTKPDKCSICWDLFSALKPSELTADHKNICGPTFDIFNCKPSK